VDFRRIETAMISIDFTETRKNKKNSVHLRIKNMPNSEIVLQTQNLTKSFGALTAVDDLSLEVYGGEVFGFLGPNGAGKTTAINLICGLLKPDAGQVFIHGKPASGAGVPGGSTEVRARVGVCPQNTILWDRLTCIEQLEFIGEMYNLPRKQARRRGSELLEILGLAEKRQRLASTLSGGMKRRLNLAMALVHDPELVVLDEPEAGLDPQSRVLVREYIKSLTTANGADAKTVILTTHNMDEADRMANRVAIIDHGRLLVLDSPAALKQRLGQGDTVEIKLENGLADSPADSLAYSQAAEAKARLALQDIASDVKLEAQANILHVRALHALGRLADILQALTSAGFHPGEVSLRANTLEDVFIQLTGRRLRE
jgi:ABC-2 type transport system ATP-binding protein